ncbi:unnamed protein product [Spodoptera exigua]|nr:unnamed protein product [Spodoptera exigua]
MLPVQSPLSYRAKSVPRAARTRWQLQEHKVKISQPLLQQPCGPTTQQFECARCELRVCTPSGAVSVADTRYAARPADVIHTGTSIVTQTCRVGGRGATQSARAQFHSRARLQLVRQRTLPATLGDKCSRVSPCLLLGRVTARGLAATYMRPPRTFVLSGTLTESRSRLPSQAHTPLLLLTHLVYRPTLEMRINTENTQGKLDTELRNQLQLVACCNAGGSGSCRERADPNIVMRASAHCRRRRDAPDLLINCTDDCEMSCAHSHSYNDLTYWSGSYGYDVFNKQKPLGPRVLISEIAPGSTSEHACVTCQPGSLHTLAATSSLLSTYQSFGSFACVRCINDKVTHALPRTKIKELKLNGFTAYYWSSFNVGPLQHFEQSLAITNNTR